MNTKPVLTVNYKALWLSGKRPWLQSRDRIVSSILIKTRIKTFAHTFVLQLSVKGSFEQGSMMSPVFYTAYIFLSDGKYRDFILRGQHCYMIVNAIKKRAMPKMQEATDAILNYSVIRRIWLMSKTPLQTSISFRFWENTFKYLG